MEEEVLNPIDPRPFIELDNGQYVYKDEYRWNPRVGLPREFEDYAKQMGKAIQYEQQLDEIVITAKGSSKEKEYFYDKEKGVGTYQEVDTPNIGQQAARLVAEAQRASDAVTLETPQVISEMANMRFKIDNAPRMPITKQTAAGPDIDYVIDPNQLESYLGTIDHEEYLNYQETGKLDLTKIPKRIQQAALEKVKDQEFEFYIRRNGDDAVINEARAQIIPNSAYIKEAQKADQKKFLQKFGYPLVGKQTIQGVTYEGPDVPIHESFYFKEALIGKEQALNQEEGRLNSIYKILDQEAADYKIKFDNLAKKAKAGEQISDIEIAELEGIRSGLLSQISLFEQDAKKYDDALLALPASDTKTRLLLKNYSSFDKLMVVLEQGFVAQPAMFLAGIQRAIAKSNLSRAEQIGDEEAIKEAEENYDFTVGQYKTAVNYNARLTNQLQEDFVQSYTLENASIGEAAFDGMINQAPSILTSLSSFGLTKVGFSAMQAANTISSIFFLMEGGGQLADLELTQLNAPRQIAKLKIDLDNAEDELDRMGIQQDIDHLENSLSLTNLQKGLSALSNATTAMLAEKYVTLGLLDNMSRFGRSIGYKQFRKSLGVEASRRASKLVGATTAFGVGEGIQLSEESVTNILHNAGNIIFLGEDKSLFDGLNAQFAFDTMMSAGVIQGPSGLQFMNSMMLDEIMTFEEKKGLIQLRNNIIRVQNDIRSGNLTPAQLREAKKKRQALIKEAVLETDASYGKLVGMQEQELSALFENTRELRINLRAAKVLGESNEMGSYGQRRFKELQEEHSVLIKERSELISRNQAREEAKLRNSAESVIQARKQEFMDMGLNEKEAGELAGQIKVTTGTATPELRRAQGLYAYNLHQLKNTKGVNVVVLKNIQEEINYRKENALELEPKGNAFINPNNNDIVINQHAIASELFLGSTTSALIAAASPLHELGHLRTKQSGILKSKELNIQAETLIDQFNTFLNTTFEEGQLSREQYDTATNRIKAYQEAYKGKDKDKILVDEMFQLINDLTNVGVLKDFGLAEIYGIKNFTNKVLQTLFGDNSIKFQINSIADAREYVASYARSTSKIQLAPDDDEIKFSLSEFNDKIKEARSDQAYKKKVNDSYNANKDLWADKESRTGQRRRENFIAERILNDDGKIMQLMGYYVDRPQPKTGAAPFSSLPGFERDLYLITAKNELLRHAINFDEAKNDDIHGWIVSQAYNKALQAVKRLGIDTSGTLSLEEEGVQKQVKAEVVQEEAPKRETAIEKAVAASATNFIREINKAVPGFLSGEVLQRIYQSIDNFIKDPANEKALNFERVPGTNKIIVQPEAAAEFQKLLSEYLIKELSDYFRNDILKRNKSAFADIVKETFKIYKLIPQSFLNKRISNWTQPLIDPRTGKQARTTVEMGGKYGGAKGNPLFERIEITQEDWVNYFNSPTAKPSTKTALKKRFAEMLASGVGVDLFLRYLGEVDANGDLVNLQQFIDQQGLPVFDGANAYGITFTEMLGRDVSAVNLKYSLNLTSVQASLLESAMPSFIQGMKKLKVKTENNVAEILKSVLPEDYDIKAIKEIAKVITPEFKKRDKILTKKIKEGKLFEKDKDIAMSEQVLFIALSQPTKEYFGIDSEINTDTLYIPKRKKGEERKITILNQDNVNIAKQGVAELFESDNFTESEKFEFFIPGFRTGNQGTIFENNQDIVDTIGIATLNDLGIIVVDNSLKYKSKRRGVGINGKNIAKQINLKGADITQQLMAIQAKRARALTIKIAKYFRNKAVKAKTEEERSTIKLQAFFITNSLNSYADSFVRKTATLDYVEDGVTQENGYFEHLLQSNILQKTIGGFITGRINEKELNKVLESMRGALLQETTAKDIDAFIKSNQPMGSTVGQDPIVRLKSPMLNAIGKNIVLRNPGNANDIISIGNSTTIESSQKLGEGIRNYTYYALPRKVQNYSLNTTRNLTIVPVYDYNTFTGEQGELLKYRSEMFRIMSGPFEYYYELNRLEGGRVMDPDIITEDAVTDDLLALSFFRYDTDLEQDSTDLTGDFTEGEKNPIKVFSIIGNSVMDFMKKQEKFKGLMFSADAETMSRVKLYDRFANMMAKKFGYEVLIQDIKGPGSGELFYRRYYVVDPAYIENGKLIKPKQQIQYSLNDMSKDFNLIIEDKFGIEEYKRFSEVVGKRRGAKKDRLNFKNFFFPPSAEDFMGLMYDLIGKGEKGDAQKQWFMDNIVMPYTIGIAQLDSARQSIRRAHRNLLTENAGLKKVLRQKIVDGDFTYDQAVRVYLWNLKGVEIPGLSQRDQKKLTELVVQSEQLKDFAGQLLALANMEQGWPDPSEYWDTETLLSDLNNLTQKANRKTYLKEFIENADTIFSPENKNKLRAALGNNWVEALEDIIYRMTNGTNRPAGTNRIVNAWNNWVNRSIGAIMFFNRRSALLQTLSTVNFINWSDNNPINAAIAFANQKQYWKDFVMIFNSDKLKERRGGLRMDVSEAEIANAAAASKNDPGAILSYLLKIGFTLTQIADSFAIASGGATFYRNRVKTYLDQGLEKEEAETKAFQDFSRISDETQQSSDPMLISQEQASVLGRLVLAFQNTSAQYTRRGRKGIRDLIMGRGDFKTNLSVSIYYLAIQNIIFNALQNALFSFIPGFDDEPEDETLTEKELERKQQKEAAIYSRAINGSLDTILRGMGLRGAVIATLKNTIMKYYEQQQKDPFFKDNAQVVLEALNISPPIGSKARKFYNALRTMDFEKDVIEERGLDLFIEGRFKPSPMYSVIGNISAAFANVPLDRAYDEVVSISEAFDQRNTEWQRLALGLGYKSWAVGAKQEEEDLIKERAKALRKAQGIEKAKKTRAENKAKKEAEERKMIEEMSIDEYIKYLNEQKKKKKK